MGTLAPLEGPVTRSTNVKIFNALSVAELSGPLLSEIPFDRFRPVCVNGHLIY